jgi:hypothetical protein
MWDYRHLTTLWASTAYCKDSFTFLQLEICACPKLSALKTYRLNLVLVCIGPSLHEAQICSLIVKDNPWRCVNGHVLSNTFVSRTDPEVLVRFLAQPDFLRSSDLERGPLSLVSTIEELLGRKSSGFGLENLDYGRRDPPR